MSLRVVSLDLGSRVHQPISCNSSLLATVKFINWGVFLVLGIFIGSFIGAKASNEFRVRVPDATTILRSGLGGILMGIGATLAGGCSIGNGLVETAFFSWQGWVSLPLMILGTWVAAYFTIIRPQRLKLAKAS